VTSQIPGTLGGSSATYGMVSTRGTAADLIVEDA
jgi:hypothetical protein